VLDPYQRRFEGRRLRRRHPTLPPAPGQACRVEFEYERNGTLAYLAGWDVHHANLFDRVEAKTGIEPFGRLVEQVMTVEPYASARTVYWIVDNGSSHAGKTSIRRMQETWTNTRLNPPPDPRLLAEPDRALLLDRPTQRAHTQRLRFPCDARRAATQLQRPLPAIARPFDWTFTRTDLDRLLTRIDAHEPELRLAA